MVSIPNPKHGMPADKGRMDLVYLDTRGHGEDFIPLTTAGIFWVALCPILNQAISILELARP
jgi:hypothetical protein